MKTTQKIVISWPDSDIGERSRSTFPNAQNARNAIADWLRSVPIGDTREIRVTCETIAEACDNEDPSTIYDTMPEARQQPIGVTVDVPAGVPPIVDVIGTPFCPPITDRWYCGSCNNPKERDSGCEVCSTAKPVLEYRVAESSILNGLLDDVGSYISEGWTPQGGVAHEPMEGLYMQAMTRTKYA